VTDDKTRIPEQQAPAQPDASEVYPYDTPMWRSIKKGTAIGFAIGFGIAQFIITTHVTDTLLFGPVYEGNGVLLYAVCLGLGAAAGAGVGWLTWRKGGSL